MPANLTGQLADFVANTQLRDVPASTRDRARIILIDAVASALMGGRSGDVPRIEQLAIATAGPGDSPVIGRPSLASAGAVLVNGYLITASTICDVHRPTLCHITPETLPPALAVAGERRVSGADFLLAFALGLEITTRVGVGSDYPAFRRHGWHSPGVWGPFGGAATAGRLLGLNSQQMRNALSLAGSQSAGTFAQWGTPAIKFQQSRGALSGYLAATLAETGFEAGADVLTHVDGGLYHTYADGGRPELAVEGLGTRWELERISLRPWPLASALQSVATALLYLVDTAGVSAAIVRRARIGLSHRVYEMHGTLPWSDRFHALLSAPYVTAVILNDGACGIDQFSPERIKSPDLGAFATRNVEVVPDESVTGIGAAVDLDLADGRTVSDRRSVPHGDAQDPLSLAEVEAKFLAAAAGVLSDDWAKAALQRLEQIEELPRADTGLVGNDPM